MFVDSFEMLYNLINRLYSSEIKTHVSRYLIYIQEYWMCKFKPQLNINLVSVV